MSLRLTATQLEEVYEQADDMILRQLAGSIDTPAGLMKNAAVNGPCREARCYRDRIKHLRDKLIGH